MNLIKLYGELKYIQANIESHIFHYGRDEEDIDYLNKMNRLIKIIEYKIGLVSQDEMSDNFFNENNDKNNWLLHTFSGNYTNDSYHYLRKCKKCGNKWYSLHSRAERSKITCC